MKRETWLKESISEMVKIQQWHKDHNIQKSNSIRLKLSLAYAVVEFVTYGRCINHKARLSATDFFKTGRDSATIKCVEDVTGNKDLASYIHKLKRFVFEDYEEWVAFTTLHSRRYRTTKNKEN